MATKLLHRPLVWTAATGIVGLTVATSTYNHETHATTLSTAPLTFSSFTTLTLSSTTQISPNVKRLTFALPATQPAALPLVSSLLTRHTPAGGLIPIFRPYTPISTSEGEVTFLIKLYPNGRASGKMHSLHPGDEMTFKSLHEFEYTPNQYQAMTLIAGGSGITPFYQLARGILDNPEDKTVLKLVYANNSPADILLKGEFDGLAKRYPGRFGVTYVVSKDEEGKSGLQTGYVTKKILEEVLPAREGGTKVLVSGPPAMTAAVAGKKGGFGWTQGGLGGILGELGYKKEEVHKF